MIIIALIRSKKAILRDMAALQEKMNEQPAIYEEIKYVQKPHSSSPTSTIDTDRNTAYMSLAALGCKWYIFKSSFDNSVCAPVSKM